MRPRFTDPKDKIKFSIRYAENGCWEWQAGLHSAGYAWVRWQGRLRYGHRLSYEAFKGPIPEGLSLDHLCRNRKCVNPDHLEPVTHKENVLRGVGITAQHARKTTCKNGHPYDVNYKAKNGTNNRRCLKCAWQVTKLRKQLRKSEK